MSVRRGPLRLGVEGKEKIFDFLPKDDDDERVEDEEDLTAEDEEEMFVDVMRRADLVRKGGIVIGRSDVAKQIIIINGRTDSFDVAKIARRSDVAS